MDERLKELRKELRLTQQAFADRLGIKRNTVATYAKATPAMQPFFLYVENFM